MAPVEPDALRKLYGTAAPPSPVEAFAKGRIAFELVDGQLRTICVDGVEVLRGIQYLVRDRDWGTLRPDIKDLVVDRSDNDLVICYVATCTGTNGERLSYAARIATDGTALTFDVEATAVDMLTANRLGFCVLHPAHLAGATLSVEHGDGSVTQRCFPQLIDPWQPFTDIVALTHNQQSLTIRCELDGDSFEMEDQRNWSDASYKTYVRPLAKPWPYEVAAGTVDRQSVRLSVSGSAPAQAARQDDEIEIIVGDVTGTMPRIGLVVTPEEAGAFAAHRSALDALGVQDLLLTFLHHDGHGAPEMTALAAAVAGVPRRRTLECVITAQGDLDTELRDIAELVDRSGLRLDAIAVYPAPDLQSTPPGSRWPDCPPLDDIYDAARRTFPTLQLGGGMYSYFTELNRKRPPHGLLDFVSHATCPIVHAADDLSVMQSLEAIPHILRSGRAILGDTPYRLGPITIGMRQNPYGSRTMPNPDRERVPMAMVDPRQDGQFAAAWTIGYAAATEDAGLEVLTPGALTGPLGLIGEDGRRPVFNAVASLAQLAGKPRRRCVSSAPGRVQVVAASETAILANLTDQQQIARIADTRVTLAPFAIATVLC